MVRRISISYVYKFVCKKFHKEFIVKNVHLCAV